MKRSLIILTLITFLVSCEKRLDCTEQYFSEEYKSFLFFNEGSYWIYEDIFLGITDTIVLLSHSLTFDSDCSFQSPPQEVFKQTFSSSYFKGENNFIWTAKGLAGFNEYIGDPLLGWYNGKEGGFIDSILINDTWYKDIIEFYHTNNRKYYRAKGIGLIKKDFDNYNSNDSLYRFELKEYHLE